MSTHHRTIKFIQNYTSVLYMLMAQYETTTRNRQYKKNHRRRRKMKHTQQQATTKLKEGEREYINVPSSSHLSRSSLWFGNDTIHTDRLGHTAFGIVFELTVIAMHINRCRFGYGGQPNIYFYLVVWWHYTDYNNMWLCLLWPSMRPKNMLYMC